MVTGKKENIFTPPCLIYMFESLCMYTYRLQSLLDAKKSFFER